MKKIIVLFILLIIPVMLFTAFWSVRTAARAAEDQEITGVGPAWYHPDWHYRRPVTVTNTSTTLTNYQILVQLDVSFDFVHARTDGSDLRVTASDGTTPLPFWVEYWDNSGNKAWVWVKVPSLPNGSTVIYLYYGNASVSSASDGLGTFEAYDGFEGYAVGAAPTGNYTNPGEWSRYAGNPVLALGTAGTWDATGATFASVFYDSAASPPYRMYYHGWGAAPCAGSCIGLATSPDGQTWTKYGSNPVLTPGSSGAWDVNGVRVPMVWKEGPNDYRMMYTGSGSGGLQVGYATSADGISWTKYAVNPVFSDNTVGSWSYHSVQNWGVIKVGPDYLMWYEDAGAPREANIATSTDLINWTPYASTPIFTTSGTPSDDRYSQFSPFTFQYGGYYYVLVASYSSVSDYARYYLYRSSSPYFPTSDRHLVRVAHTAGASGQWDALDADTPAVLTSDIERSIFPGNQLWTYFAGASATNSWREGLLVEANIASALTDAALPSGLSWAPDAGVTVVSSPVRQGLRSVQLVDPPASSKNLIGTFSPQEQGVLGVWIRRDNTTVGDFDLYAKSGGTIAAVVGLGRNGKFHYWNGIFVDTSISWSINTWYLVTMIYNANTDRYDFVAYDQTMTEIARQSNISFGNAVVTINVGLLNTSTAFVGNGYGDDYRLRKYVSPEPGVAVRPYSDIQETQAIVGPFPTTPDFSLVGITVTVTSSGSLTSLQVIRYEHDHPNGTYVPATGGAHGTKTGRYWEIIPDNTGYTVNLTLPHNSVPDADDKVCRWTGTGVIWDCDVSGYDTGNGTVWRNGITQLSEWATGNDVGPTAVNLIGLTATSTSDKIWQTTLAASLVFVLAAAGIFWRHHLRTHL